MTKPFSTIEVSDSLYDDRELRIVTARSPALGRRVDMTLWIPPVDKIDTLLILLHGVYGSHWVWSEKGGVGRTAQKMLAAGEMEPMVIAMPSDGLQKDGSAYLNHGEDGDAEQWIVDEVPQLAQLAAPALNRNSKMAISGLSMGGYGALRLGAKYCGHFSHISAHSAITDIDQMSIFTSDPLDIYLQTAPREELSTIYWLRKNRDSLPRIRFDCGVKDSLIEANRELHRALDEEHIPHQYREFPGGHEWPYWREHVKETLLFVSEA